MKILIFTLALLVSLALTRIPVAALARSLRRAPGSWNRYVSPLLVPLQLLLTAAVVHGALSFLRSASSPSVAAVYASFAWLLLRAVTTLVYEWWFADVRGVDLPSVLRRVLSFTFGAAALLALLNMSFDVPLIDLAFAMGGCALIAALFFQGVMRDALLGVSMLLEKRVVVGDWVRLDRHEGEVVAVDWKSTTLRTADDEQVVLPNRLIVDSAIVRGRGDGRRRRARLEIELPGDLPPGAVLAELSGAASSTRAVLREPAPTARLLGSSDGRHRFEVQLWVADVASLADVASEARAVFWYRLRRAGLLPQPTLSDFEQTRAALAGVPLFATVAPDALARLARSVSVQRFGRGEVIFRQGEPGDTLLVVLSGQLDVLLDVGTRSQLVASVGAGSFVGERSLLTGEVRSATAAAAQDTVALVIGKADMLEVLRDDAELAGRIAHVMADRAAEDAELERARGGAPPASSLLAKIRAIFSL